ncbi:MAG: sigma 54-interacting transcriptional regulator [Clostridia bacterium]|nr:sigma 54-interacting transcriptional regulator [Clostridia bacterium]
MAVSEPNLKVLLIGAGKRAFSVSRWLSTTKGIELVKWLALPDEVGEHYPKSNIQVLADPGELATALSNSQAHVIVWAPKQRYFGQRNYWLSQVQAEVQVITAEYVPTLLGPLAVKEELEETRKLKGELAAILNSVQEAIEVADGHGRIKYVNPSFTRVTGIPAAARIGQNILEASPSGALAQALITQKPVIGYRTKVGGSGVEVISNASPIVIDGKIEGAVVVFQPMNDLIKLMEELKKSNTVIENLYAQMGQMSGAKYTFDDLVGKSKLFKASIEMAKKAAKNDSTVLILGESGTGKEIFAHAIHNGSSRKNRPFIKVNCAAIPESLLESEFFGYERGAFTGATRTKLGRVELANGGTLFLDEIGDMSPFLQAKMLRFLQDMEFERVGGTQTLKANVRVIAATNRDLKMLVRKGSFREDLYYRLAVFELRVPPLRERKEDIGLIANYLLAKFNRKLGKHVERIAPEAMELLINYDWPGNVRELENVIERAMILADGDELSYKCLAQYLLDIDYSAVPSTTDLMPLDKMEQVMLRMALARYGNSLEGKRKAAKSLNISLATLYNKLKKYGANLG